MSNRGNSQPLLSDVPEDTISPSPPRISREGSLEAPDDGGVVPRREDSVRSAASAQTNQGVVIRVLENSARE